MVSIEREVGSADDRPNRAAEAEPMTPLLDVTAIPVDEGATLADVAGSPVVAVGVPVFESDAGPVLAQGLEEIASASIRPAAPEPELCARRGFSGEEGQAMVLLPQSGGPATVYLGFGKPESLGADELRLAAASLVRAAGRSGAAVILLPRGLAERACGSAHSRAVQALAEGAVLAAYRFSSHKSKAERRSVEHLLVAGVGLDARALAEGAARGVRVACAVCAARDLVNEPPSSMTPRRLAEMALELAGASGSSVSPGSAGSPASSPTSSRSSVSSSVSASSGSSASIMTLEVWDEERIEAEHLGGLLGVARGSAEPPSLIRAEYEPTDPLMVDGHVPHVVLVGKGITFDSGGLSLKSADGMVSMKTDMSGAATVLATVSACADLGVRVRVTALAPATENMPGGKAIKPGDVLTVRDGQTIEVLNTDAEGRLVLADALSLAVELNPDAIIDLATLTGAAVVALGGKIAGVFGNDRGLMDRLKEAAVRAGEPIWQLPLVREYRSHIDSDVADMKNIGKAGQAGSIAAALLLERFVGSTPWVHIDMAGPARSDEDEGVLTKGGTGFGVRTLLELLESYGDAAPV